MKFRSSIRLLLLVAGLLLLLLTGQGLNAAQSWPIAGDLYALDTDNSLWLFRGNGFQRQIQIKCLQAGEVLIGIDFRPADGQLYALSDQGNIYQIDTTPPGRGNAYLVSSLSLRFAGGFQSLLDFNPVVDAIRLIGSNDQNFAIVSANGGTFNLTVMQARIAYAAGDRNAGIDPNLVGGAYSNNVAGAQNTLFYALDYDLDLLVTIAARANGSSATGGGQLTTIGRLLRQDGSRINLTPSADIDIYTDASGGNTLIGISGRTLFSLDLAGVQPNQDQTVRAITLRDGGFIDLAIKQ